MYILKRCPCINRDLKDYFISDDDEDLFESDTYGEVKNDWEWLSLRHERRLNEVLNLVKHSRNADNDINKINLSTFLSFTPKLLQNHLHRIMVTNTEWNGKSLDDKPFENIFDGNAAVMFCDISGFTRLVELIESSEDLESVSNLGQFLNNFFDPLINLIHFYKGDIIKFSGDAMLSIFYPLPVSSSGDELDQFKGRSLTNKSGNLSVKTENLASELRKLAKKLGKDHLETYIQSPVDDEDVDPAEAERAEKEACVNCLKCCRDLHNILNNYPMPLLSLSARDDESNKIKLHIGCSYGRIKMKCVGGIFERYEYYLTGDPLNDLSILGIISKSDQTLLSDAFYKKVEGEIRVQHIEYNNNRYYEFMLLNEDEQSDKMVRRDTKSGLYERATSTDGSMIDGYSDDETSTGDEDRLRTDRPCSRILNESTRWKDEMSNLNNYYRYISQNSARHKYILQREKEQFIESRFHSKELSELLKNSESNLEGNKDQEQSIEFKENEAEDKSESGQDVTLKKNEDDTERQRQERFKQRYIKILSSFMPRYIYNKLYHGFNIHNNEMRKITIVFANFEFLKPMRRNRSSWNNKYVYEEGKGVALESVDLIDRVAQTRDLGTDEDVDEEDKPLEQRFLSEDEIERKINVIMKICQKACYSFEGSINKLILDDKGLIILMIMGFPPLFHEDDALRAIFCGLKIANDTKKIDVNVGIGIATGRVWCGTLGNDIRKEYTALGDIVNISCRLMLNAMKLSPNTVIKSASGTDSMASVGPAGGGLNALGNMAKVYNILVDNNNFNECKDYVELIELEPIKLKGKSDMFRVYTPTGRLYNTPKTHIFDEINTKNRTHVNLKSVDGTNVATIGVHSSNTSIPGLNNGRARLVLDELYNINQVSLRIVSKMNNLKGKTLFINCNDSNNNQLAFYYVNHLLSEAVNSSYCSEHVNVDDSSVDTSGTFAQQMEKLKRLFSNYKILNINHNKHNKLIYNELEDVYKLLILDIMNIWSNSSTRSDFYVVNGNGSQPGYVNEAPINRNSCTSEASGQLTSKQFETKLLKELLDPKLHWNLNILNRVISNLRHNNQLLTLLFNNKTGSNNSVLKHLYKSLSGETFIDNTSYAGGKFGGVNCDVVGAVNSSVSHGMNDANSGMLEEELENKLLLLVEKEKLDVSEYIYSLIEGINLHYPIVLVVNGSHDKPTVEDNRLIGKLLKRSCEHESEACTRKSGLCEYEKKELISVVINFSHEFESNNPINRSHTINFHLPIHCYHKINSSIHSTSSVNNDADYANDENTIEIQNLTKPHIKALLGNLLSTEEFSGTKILNVEEVVDDIYNTTSGIYYFTFKYLNYLLNTESSGLEDGFKENSDVTFEKDANDPEGSDYSKAVSASSSNSGVVKDAKLLLEELDGEIGNYFKYKLDQLEPRELFALKILVLLDKPITERKLADIMNSNHFVAGKSRNDIVGGLSSIESVWGSEGASFREGHQDSISSVETKNDKKQVMRKLLGYNLVVSQEDSLEPDSDSHVDSSEGSDTPSRAGDEASSGSNEPKYYVNNRIIKKIINERILIEEKSHIINDYLSNHA